MVSSTQQTSWTLYLFFRSAAQGMARAATILGLRAAALDTAARPGPRRLSRTFLRLADCLEDAAERELDASSTPLPGELAEVLCIVARCGRHTAEALTGPGGSPRSARYREEIRRSAADADDALRRLSGRWYFDVDDAATLPPLRAVRDELGEAMRAFEAAAVIAEHQPVRRRVHPAGEVTCRRRR